ncbi:UNVERIFIED_CONTAM: hypothetical protein H355_013747 [Colinus virginianus]|nr:hypothetical protein H355_013747 [Colinus virginianus]
MEAVNAFNQELFSLMEMKPPISRAKMILITKAAIKAIKLYKHVVQIVEKFIKKCKPEYKVPGLYVIDSIVRQSRHQFGTDKDVFGPRFSKNITATFQYLYLCPSEDKLQQILQTFQQPQKAQSPVIDNTVMAQVQAITAQLKTTASQPPEQKAAFPQPEQKTSFDKKLLDRFDYDDEPEAVEDSKKEDSAPSPSVSQPTFGFAEGIQQPVFPQLPNMDPFQQRMMGMQQDPMRHQVPLPPNGQMPGFGLLPTPQFPPMAQPVIPPTAPVQQTFQTPFPVQSEPHMQKTHQPNMEVEQPPIQERKRHVSDSRKSRSRSASRSPKRRRSRSGSRSRRSRHRRSRSRSRDRRRHSPKSRSQERRERERERERRSKGLPQIKSETVSVCSTTLWVGQLDKRTTQQDVGSLLEEFGPIESINIAWALNKGIKPDYKQYWDVELGVTYIPWDKVKPEDLESFCEGGMLDNETLSPEWKGIPKKSENEVAQNGGAEAAHNEPVSPIPKALPVPIPVPMPAPITVPPPQVPPHPSGPPVVGALQPPAFTAPLGIPPPGFAPGVPPPPPPPFLRPGFNPMHLPPGFLPPGPPPPITPPVSVPHTPAVNIPNSTATGVSEDTTKDASVGNPIPTVVSGSRGNAETTDSSKIYATVPPPVAPTNVPAPVTQAIPLLGFFMKYQKKTQDLKRCVCYLFREFLDGHFVRPGGMPGSGTPSGPEENRDGRQFRNDRQTFTPNRDQERFGRRSFGNRVENDRERYGSRSDDRDHERLGNRDRREWGRRSPERDRHRDMEDRNRRSSGHRDRERDSRDRESRRDKEESRGKEKTEATDRADGDKNHESHSGKMEDADVVSELAKGECEPSGVKPEEELTAEATSSVEQAEKDLSAAAEAPR